MVQIKVVKCPNEALSLTNCLVVSSNDFDPEIVKYVEILHSHKGYVYSTLSGEVYSGSAGFSYVQRKWTGVALNTPVQIVPYKFSDNSQLASITVDADFFQKSKTTPEGYDTEKMSEAFTEAFFGQPMSEGQPVVFSFNKKPLLLVTIKSLEVLDMSMLTSSRPSRKAKDGSDTLSVPVGVITRNTQILFERAENSVINLTGKARGKAAHQSLISSNWDFTDLGIGGLDKEFTNIVRRAFATRIFPSDVVEKMGLRHVKGILLHGPPGTGKTLMARQLGKMLNTRDPQIISGPEILNKYVGESEANIRKLFAAAEEDQKKFGDQSALHLIIFDEFDAVCKSRYMYNTGGTGVQDSVVNQLLAKIDGVEQLNNVLLIGMTNRRDLIDDALMRPGRLEVQVEIGLPDEVGRVQILQIHTSKMKENDLLASDVDLEDIAAKTKNFSGAELEGLVRAAQSTAMNKFIDIKSNFEVDPEAIGKIRVTQADFDLAIENDIKPAFGSSDDNLDVYVSGGMIRWSPRIQDILDDGKLLLQQTREQEITMPVSVLIEGPVSSGKTALAIKTVLESDFPFIKLCTPENMIGFTETAKCQTIKKIFDDADKSHLSCIIIDDIERLLDFVPIGMRFSNTVLQALLVLLKKKLRKDRKLLIIGTTSCRDVLDQMSLVQAFTKVIHVPNITKTEHLRNVLQEMDLFKPSDIDAIERGIGHRTIWVGIKKVLMLAEMAVQTTEELRVDKFLSFLEDENCLRDTLS